MASNKTVRFGPVQLSSTNATTLIAMKFTSLSGPSGWTATQPYAIIRHIRLVNTSSSAATASLFVGAAATATAGTEFLGSALSVPGNSYVDWYGMLRLDGGASTAECLCGGSGTNDVITLIAEGEVGLA